MMIITKVVRSETISSTLLYLWLATLVVFILWLLARRLRQQLNADVYATAVTPVQSLPLTPRQHAQMLAAMIVGGLLVLVLGQICYSSVPTLAKWAVLGLMAVGGGLFLWAGSRIRRDQFAGDVIARRLHDLGQWLGVAGWQVVLLGLAAGLSWLAHLAAGEQALARHWGVSTTAWLLALGCCLVGGLPLAEGMERLRHGLGLSRWEWLIICGLMTAAWLLRGTAVSAYPDTFSGDEGSAGLHAALFLKDQANNWFTIGWFSFPSLYYALQALFIDLFGQTIEALRFLAAFGGTLAVGATYILARVMFDRGTAVAAAVVIMSSHYHIHLSRIGLNNVWDSLFTAVTLAAIWVGWRSERRLPFLLAGLALGLGQYFYVTGRVLPLLLLIWWIGLWWRQPARWRRSLPHFLLSGYTAVITVLPLAIYFAGNWAEFQAPFNRVTIWGERLISMAAAEGQPQVVLLLRQMSLAAQGFTHLPLRLLYEPGVPLLLPLSAGLFLAGLAWLLLRFDGRSTLLLLPLLAVILLSGFSQDPPASQRYILALPVTAVLVALPLGLASRWLRQLWPEGRMMVHLATAVVLLWLSLVNITFYFGELYESYRLGGINTVVATDVARYLLAEPEPPAVYFFGFPRMGYYSLGTIPYLVPEVEAVDLSESIASPPAWELTKTTLFLFLPERLDEFEFVQQAYPTGAYEEVLQEGSILYAVYRVEP